MGEFIPLPDNKPSHFPQYQLALALKTRMIILDKVYGVQLGEDKMARLRTTSDKEISPEVSSIF